MEIYRLKSAKVLPFCMNNHKKDNIRNAQKRWTGGEWEYKLLMDIRRF